MALQETKGKTKKAQRALQKREPKVLENPKTALFIRGHKTSQLVTDVLNDLIALKKPDALRYFKRQSNGDKGPFESIASVEFFSQKSDASLFVFGSHSKKRPNNLVIGRMFNYHILDMLELGITNFKPIQSFNATKLPMLGSKPCFTVVGSEFSSDPIYEMAANLVVDFFRGRVIDNICLAGIDHVVSLSVGTGGSILFRHYAIHMKKSGERVPRVELEEVGPSIDFSVRRHQFGESSLRKESLRKPKELNPKKKRNVKTNIMRDTVGNIHVPKQNVDMIEKRAVKPKALKRPTKKRKRSDNESGEISTESASVGSRSTRPEKKLKSSE